MDIFGYENVKIILFDDIIENERAIYLDILNFLGVKNSDFTPPTPDRNPSHALRFVRLREFVFSPPIKKWLYTKTPQKLLPIGAKISQKIFKKEQEKPFVSKEDINRLKLRFRDDVEDLNSYLVETNLRNRDIITLWGYS